MKTCLSVVPIWRVFAFSLASLGLCCALAVPALAGPPWPLYGSRVVDGDESDWNLSLDFYDYLFRSGDPTFPIEANLYLRHDCTTNTVYILVLTTEDVVIRAYETRFHWAAINDHSNKVVQYSSGNDGTPPDFAWVGLYSTPDGDMSLGWEGSFPLLPGSYRLFVGSRVIDSGKVETAANRGHTMTGLPLVLDCTVPVEQSTWGKVKGLYR